MNMRHSVVAVLVLGALATGAQAVQPPKLKPGLWEMQMQGGHMGGQQAPDAAEMSKAMQQMQAQLAKMPPEQRKMIEAQMGNMGVAMSNSGGIRICLTEEDIKRDAIPVSDGKCSSKVKSRTANRWVMTHACTDPVTSGEAEVVFEGSQAYRVKAKGTVVQNGKTQPYEMAMRMQHVSADCGKVKPASEAQKAYEQQLKHLQKPARPSR